MKKIILILVLLWGGALYGQVELIRNGSFEDINPQLNFSMVEGTDVTLYLGEYPSFVYIENPDLAFGGSYANFYSSQFPYYHSPNDFTPRLNCKGWYQPTLGNPDYIHELSNYYDSKPTTLIGEAAHSGDAAICIKCSGSGPGQNREYIQQSFTNTDGDAYVALKAGSTYKITFYVHLEAHAQNYTPTDKIGVYISETPFVLYDNDQLTPTTILPAGEFVYDKNNTLYDDTQNWQLFEATYTPPSNREAITIGIMEDNNYLRGDYAIDDVSIVEINCPTNCADFQNDLIVTKEGCCLKLKLNNGYKYGQSCGGTFYFNHRNAHTADITGDIEDLKQGIIFCPEEYPLLEDNSHFTIFIESNNNYWKCEKYFDFNSCSNRIEPILKQKSGCCYDLTFQEQIGYYCNPVTSITLQELDANGDDYGSALTTTLDGTIEICDTDGDGILKYDIAYYSGDECVGNEEISQECDDCCNKINIEVKQSTHSESDCCHRFEISTDQGYTCDAIASVKAFDIADTTKLLFEEDYNANTQYKEMCVYSEEDTQVKFHFYDAAGVEICSQVKTIPACTCACPDFEELYNINQSDCNNGESCYFILFPKNFDLAGCYSKFDIITEIELANNQFEVINELSLSLSEFRNYGITRCVEKYKFFKVTLKLYIDENDTDPCVLEKKLTCFDNNETRPDCDLGCPEEYKSQDALQVPIPGGNGCVIQVKYETRDKCDNGLEPWQDVHIYYIQITGGGLYNPCNIPDTMALRLALAEIARKNVMNFDPQSEGCNDMWRVSKASCWAAWTTVYEGPYSTGNEPIIIGIPDNNTVLGQWWIYSYRPCEADCCARRVRVCRDTDGSVTIEDLGMVVSASDSCALVTKQIPWGGESPAPFIVPCNFDCDFLGAGPYTSKASAPQIENNLFDLENKEILAKFNINITNESLDIVIDKTSGSNIGINISDMKGRMMENLSYELVQNGQNTFDIDLRKLNSGNYVYSITIDGKRIASDNFIIIK